MQTQKEVKHYPRPEYCKCNAGHTLVEVFNEKRNCYEWDCPICIAKMQKAEKEENMEMQEEPDYELEAAREYEEAETAKQEFAENWGRY